MRLLVKLNAVTGTKYCKELPLRSSAFLAQQPKIDPTNIIKKYISKAADSEKLSAASFYSSFWDSKDLFPKRSLAAGGIYLSVLMAFKIAMTATPTSAKTAAHIPA